MTPRQKTAFDFIRRYKMAHGHSPSYENIADYMGLASKSGVYRLVHALKRQGKIVHHSNKARTIEIVKDDFEEFVRAKDLMPAYRAWKGGNGKA